MNLEGLKTFGGPVVQRTVLKVQKYAPEILTGGGLLAGIGSTILAARATLKLEALVLDYTERIADIKAYREAGGEYTEDIYRRDMALVYARWSLDLAKLYGPAVSLGLISITAVLGAHGIMRRRQVAIIAAYKAIETAFSEYRERVAAEFGDQKDLDIARGLRTQKIKNPETGKTETVKTHTKPGDPSMYARIFDEFNPNFVKNAQTNLIFLKSKQMYWNDRLIARGHVFLNEVYEDLGFKQERFGQMVGWLAGKDGDNFIDFGIYDLSSPEARAFVNGDERAVFLDFNVDGVILNDI